MITNGLYALSSEMLDGAVGGNTGVMVICNGTMRGGDVYFYFVGSYTCSDGKWKGEVISKEHTPAPATRLFARKVVSMGFSGTYTDEGAELHLAALAGKRSIRMKVTFRLLVAD
jgi:hypothetical protein